MHNRQQTYSHYHQTSHHSPGGFQLGKYRANYIMSVKREWDFIISSPYREKQLNMGSNMKLLVSLIAIIYLISSHASALPRVNVSISAVF